MFIAAVITVVSDLLTPRDAGRLLGLSSWRVQQLDREGKLRAFRDSGGRRLFRKADVLRFKTKRERAKAGESETALVMPDKQRGRAATE